MNTTQGTTRKPQNKILYHKKMYDHPKFIPREFIRENVPVMMLKNLFSGGRKPNYFLLID